METKHLLLVGAAVVIILSLILNNFQMVGLAPSRPSSTTRPPPILTEPPITIEPITTSPPPTPRPLDCDNPSGNEGDINQVILETCCDGTIVETVTFCRGGLWEDAPTLTKILTCADQGKGSLTKGECKLPPPVPWYNDLFNRLFDWIREWT